MCWCTPSIRTHCCGRPACRPPAALVPAEAARPVLPPPPAHAPEQPPRRPFSLEDLGTRVGLKPGEATELAVAVQANHRLLESCPRHDFADPVDPPGSRLRIRWRCVTCTGVVESLAKHWYERGLRDARA